MTAQERKDKIAKLIKTLRGTEAFLQNLLEGRSNELQISIYADIFIKDANGELLMYLDEKGDALFCEICGKFINKDLEFCSECIEWGKQLTTITQNG